MLRVPDVKAIFFRGACPRLWFAPPPPPPPSLLSSTHGEREEVTCISFDLEGYFMTNGYFDLQVNYFHTHPAPK